MHLRRLGGNSWGSRSPSAFWDLTLNYFYLCNYWRRLARSLGLLERVNFLYQGSLLPVRRYIAPKSCRRRWILLQLFVGEVVDLGSNPTIPGLAFLRNWEIAQGCRPMCVVSEAGLEPATVSLEGGSGSLPSRRPGFAANCYSLLLLTIYSALTHDRRLVIYAQIWGKMVGSPHTFPHSGVIILGSNIVLWGTHPKD